MLPFAQAAPHTRAALGSLVQIAARVAALALGLVLLAYLSRRLGVAQYGLYAVAVMLVSWISISVAVAVTGVTVKLVAGTDLGLRYAATMLQFVAAGTGTLALLVAGGAPLLAALLGSPDLIPLLRILAAELLCGCLAAVYSGILVGQGKLAANAAAVVSGSALQLLAAFLLVEHGGMAAGAAAAVVAGSLAQVAIGRLGSGVPLFTHARVPFADLWGHAKFLAGAQLALRVVQSIDLLAVKVVERSAVAAGLYAGGQNISFGPILLFLPSGPVVLQSLASSRRAGRMREAEHTAMLYLRTSLAYGALLCALAVCADRIVVLILGPAFAASGPVLALLLWAVAFRVVSSVGRTMIAAVGEKPSIILPLLVIIVCGIAAYALAIPAGGINAAAAVALGLSAAAAFTSLREGLRLLGLSFPWLSLARVVLAAFPAAAVAASIPGLFAALAAAVATYALLLVALGEWRPGGSLRHH